MKWLVIPVSLTLLFGRHCHGLECYACNNEVSGGACEFDAASTGITTECSEIYDYCYTRRVEEEGRTTAEITRGCCRIETGSPTCPPGPEFQMDVQTVYTYYYTRCEGDLCNDTDGTGGDDDETGGALVVDGVPEDYDYFDKEGDDSAGAAAAASKRTHLVAALASVSLLACWRRSRTV